MKRIRMIGLCLVAAFAVSATAAASASAGKYIVVLKDSVGDPGAVAQQQAKDDGAQVSRVYSHALKGYSATIPAKITTRPWAPASTTPASASTSS